MRFVVLRLDVVHSEDEMLGWAVTEATQIGTINVADSVYEDDILLLDILNATGYTDNLFIDDVYFMADDNTIELREEETDRPILALEVEQ